MRALLRRAALVLAIGTAAVAAAASPAHAADGPTIAQFTAEQFAPMLTVTGSGFTPNGGVLLWVTNLSDGQVDAAVVVTAQGAHRVCHREGNTYVCQLNPGGQIAWQGDSNEMACGQRLQLQALDFSTGQYAPPVTTWFTCLQ